MASAFSILSYEQQLTSETTHVPGLLVLLSLWVHSATCRGRTASLLPVKLGSTNLNCGCALATGTVHANLVPDDSVSGLASNYLERSKSSCRFFCDVSLAIPYKLMARSNPQTKRLRQKNSHQTNTATPNPETCYQHRPNNDMHKSSLQGRAGLAEGEHNLRPRELPAA